MRVMSAGDGYKYLLRTVAAGDGNRSLSTPLTRYYNAEGTPPGRWMGSGLPALGTGQITSGDEVSEAQLQLLVGMGRDPVTGAPLGRAYLVYETVAQRIEERTATLDPHLDPAARARANTSIEDEEARRGTRDAAGRCRIRLHVLNPEIRERAVGRRGRGHAIPDRPSSP